MKLVRNLVHAYNNTNNAIMNVTNTNIHDYTDYGVEIQNHQILINLDTNFNIEVYLLLTISTGIIYNASNIPPEY